MSLGKEDIIHKNFAIMVKFYKELGRLHCKWYSYDPSGEYRPRKTGALLKSKGLHPGKSDYEFKITKDDDTSHHIYIEFKTEVGKQSKNQKLFELTCDAINEYYYIARSVDDGIEILREHKIII